MSVEHDNLPVDPRLDALLHQIVAADLLPEQNARVRAQLGLAPDQLASRPTLTLPASQPASIRTQGQDGSPMIATTRARLRQQWLQFALAVVTFIAVGVVLTMIFGSGADGPETRPGADSSPLAGLMDDALTVEEAQERLSFDLILPETWPGSLSVAGVFVTDDNRMASVWLTENDETVPAVTITQTTESVRTPAAEDMQQAMLDSMDEPPTIELPDPTQTTVIIAGRTILQTIVYDANAQPIYLYSWSQSDIHIDVDSFTRTQSEVEQVVEAIASLPDPATPSGQATATTTSQDLSVLPTPDETGTYSGITLEQAQAIVPFEISMPQRLADGLEPASITVVESPPLAAGGRVYRVEMYFELSGDESPRKGILFTQVASPGTGNSPEGETTTTTIDGVEVNRTTSTNAAGSSLLTYWWERDDIDNQILATPEGDLTAGLVEDLMLAILVPSGPTAEEQSVRLEQERADLMPFPIPDTCAVTGWVRPDFRVGQQYASAYFLDGDGLSLGTTHGLLFAGENQISWFADAPLTTSEALSGSATIHAVQPGSDGSTVEIPIEVIEQINGGGKDPSVERAWWTTTNFPLDGCWEIEASLGEHSLSATVYVYPFRDTSGITFDEQRVDEIALADPRVQALLADHPHEVADVGMWTGEWGRLIGGIVAISVSGPENIEGEWFEFSMLDCVTQPPPDPVVVSYRAEYAGVAEIHVLLDLSNESVVLIYPFSQEDQGISLVGEREFTGEYDEIRQCDTGD